MSTASTRAVLRDGSAARYLVGNYVTTMGTWFHDVASVILVFQLTGSATAVGAVTAAGYGTSLVLAPAGGQLADRVDRRRLLMVSHVLLSAAAAGLAIAVAAGIRSPALVVAVSAVMGIGRAVNTPTLHSMLPSVVPVGQLSAGVAAQAATFQLARATGPLVGASLATGVGPAAAFGLNALTFLVFAAVLPTVRVRAAALDVQDGAAAGARRLADGVAHVRRNPDVALLLLLVAVVGMGTDPVLTLAPPLARSLGEGDAFVGQVATAFGCGSFVVVWLAPSIRARGGRVRTGLGGLATCAAGLGVMAATPSPAWVLAGAAVAGMGFVVGNTDLTATLQEGLPERVRGRVMALWTMAFLGSRPIAAGLNGTVSDLTSPRTAITVQALVLVVGLVVGAIWWPRVGAGHAPPRSPQQDLL